MKKILIIENDLSIAEMEKDYLALSNFEVTVVTDGIEGEKRALTGNYDIVLLEVELPGQDGFEVCQKYREQFLKPIIFVTDKKEDIDIIHGLGLGADDYITKPFSPGEFVARVKAHLNHYQTLTEQLVKPEKEVEKITAGELEIDRLSRRVYVAGEEKKLTSKEFDLLFFLAKFPNHVYSKERLFQEVWGYKVAGDVATVTVHIKKIREKIEKDVSNPQYIETIWGAGYRFKSNL